MNFAGVNQPLQSIVPPAAVPQAGAAAAPMAPSMAARVQISRESIVESSPAHRAAQKITTVVIENVRPDDVEPAAAAAAASATCDLSRAKSASSELVLNADRLRSVSAQLPLLRHANSIDAVGADSSLLAKKVTRAASFVADLSRRPII